MASLLLAVKEEQVFEDGQPGSPISDEGHSSDATICEADMTYTLPCYGHLPGDSSADEADTLNQRSLLSRRKLAVQRTRKASRNQSAPNVQPQTDVLTNMDLTKEEFARMVSQNALLASENQRLREECEKAAAAATAAAAAASAAANTVRSTAPATPQGSSPAAAPVPVDAEPAFSIAMANGQCGESHPQLQAMQQMHFPQQYVGQWWAPTPMPVAAMSAPMMPAPCFMWPAPESMAEPPRQSRQQRRKLARQGRSGDSTTTSSSTVQSSKTSGNDEIDCPEHERTTVMLRNMPNNYTRKMLLQMLDSEGFARQYNFVYMPIDFKSKASLGYAFINLISPDVARRFWAVFEGYSRWMLPTRKMSRVSWSSPHQGLEAHLDRYRNSPLMHADVPDEYRPILLVDGVRAPFPAPSKRVRAPRLRHSPIERLNLNNNHGSEQQQLVHAQGRSLMAFDDDAHHVHQWELQGEEQMDRECGEDMSPRSIVGYYDMGSGFMTDEEEAWR